MSLWTAQEAAAATGGKAGGDWQAGGVSIDTRSLRPGDLFVALKDVRDGHDFVAQALEKGAAAALVSRDPGGADPGKLLIVEDVLPALERLGAAARARTQARVIGVTGSVGKTSTKEMLRIVLERQGRTHAAEASYNNHWGVPLTLARMPADADFAVIEIGMNAPGEIAPLARLARLDLAMITTVAAAHLAAFDDLRGIAAEKAAIFEGLEPGGQALLPGDLEVSDILRHAAEANCSNSASFGAGEFDHKLTDLRLTGDATVARANIGGNDVLFKLSVPGRHFAMNAVAVLSVVEMLGLDLAMAAQDLGRWQPVQGRGVRERRLLDPVDPELSFDLIDDAFNANPTSLVAALEVLAASAPRDGLGRIQKGRRIAVLGDMLEMGPQEAELHAALADQPSLELVDQVHCVGPLMRHLYEALPPHQRGEWVATAPELVERAGGLIDAGDVALVKGSKGSKVSLVVDALRKLSHPLPDGNEG
ncbi:UDP-N-acetylmuramoylalanyl-D-glutamyl-2,6-diaminopimelate--D-alanyl-D-alanine ligase [Candidatus Rhodobacter oscarellae]|uniref:UDP-N-acetylmuramoyl-tripeptide--D-alanyl-D-alanine ligase n=1 Tax=Candidatus Rhodobacter oscarellae TaxID=1675527 RepID=A0A0J9E5R7_9RHOB|nr:UDP-N-acetylmuramoyl-tripeptide--D-alanyl-D-alanine ligase [Candidatus Rhodobacter lobularis]KMW58077.1 UDP-N-acetylmuramoylalanyl-D-glutamyl-2,6-diaminopimelate--D-alanyl-D-alanine ligase [Candidatus Rhodobacter lobularis]